MFFGTDSVNIVFGLIDSGWTISKQYPAFLNKSRRRGDAEAKINCDTLTGSITKNYFSLTR